MKLYFKKPANPSGYCRQLIVDDEEKTIKEGYFLFTAVDCVKLAPVQFQKLIDIYKKNGYKVKEDF